MTKEIVVKGRKYHPDYRWKSAIAEHVDEHRHVLVGYRMRDVIRNLDFGQTVFLALFGRLPTPAESRMTNAMLSSFISGPPSSSAAMAARFIITTAPENILPAILGGSLAFGSLHGAAIKDSVIFIQEGVKRMKQEGASMEKMAKALVDEFLAKGQRIPGIGHPAFTKDERIDTLNKMAEKLGFYKDHCKLYREVEKITVHRLKIGPRAIINDDGCCAAILSDMIEGFDWRLSEGFFMIARIAIIVANVYEEMVRGGPRRMVRFGDPEDKYGMMWLYDGPPERPLPKKYRRPL